MSDMDFDAFAAMLIERLNLEDPPPLQPFTGMFDDLGIDSFQAFEVLIIIETAAGLDVPPPELPEIFTLGDAFEYYRSARALATAAAAE
jgi:acyl carrier protein